MKLFFFFALLLSSGVVLADDSLSNQPASNQPIQQILKQSQESQQSECRINKDNLADLNVNKNLERSGCCSHHGGVCGCTGGRAQCCDGELSPSCGCD